MTRQFFGTDGVRGVANEHPMTAEFALKLAHACAHILPRNKRSSVVIGKDTRLSGYLFEQALTAGFVGCGVDVLLLGPIPTPAVAYLTEKYKADFGIVISASHNPYTDNGIKLIGSDGYKLSDTLELEIEAAMDQPAPLVQGDALGKATRLEDALAQYEHHILSGIALHQASLQGLKIVLDCANGAAYRAAPHILRQFGASLTVLHAQPDGVNINAQCGATHLDSLPAQVRHDKAHLGIALDGDADRVMLVDETGAVIDGDQILAALSADLPPHQAVASTQMANLGLERFLATQGRALIRTSVGDRYVLEAMREHNLSLGGEPSGHIIFGGGKTGDGLRAALHIALHLHQAGGPASQTLRRFTPVPQILHNIRAPRSVMNDLEHDIRNANQSLGTGGRILVRASGTEPLIRVMVEGDDASQIQSIVNELSAKIEHYAAQAAQQHK